jgi:hypothetical protein
VQTDQSRYIETLLKLYLGLPETPSQASSSAIRLTSSSTNGGSRLKSWKRRCCWLPYAVYSAIHLFHRCRRSAHSITPSWSSAKSQSTRFPMDICITFITSLNPISPRVGPRVGPALPLHSANRSFSFTIAWPVTAYSRPQLISSPQLVQLPTVSLANLHPAKNFLTSPLAFSKLRFQFENQFQFH